MSDYKARVLEQAEIFAAPIPGNLPSGRDVSADDPAFDDIVSEIEKLSAISGGQPDWRDIVEKSSSLLKTKSKDVRLLVYSTIARLHVSGIDGLAESFAIALRVATVHWETMSPSPKNPAARPGTLARLFDWMNELAIPLLVPLEPTVASGDAFRAAQEFYDDLDSLLSERLAAAYSSTAGSRLRSLLRDKVRGIPEEIVETPATPSPTETTASPTSPTSERQASSESAMSAPEIPSIGSAADVMDALQALRSGILEAAKHLRKADPANAWAYRLHRTAIWLRIQTAPEAVSGKQTRLPSPGERRKALDAKLAGEQWLDLLNTAEELSGQFMYWLDLHRYVATAMDRLGATFLDARATVGREVVGFLQRFPAVLSLTFNDGTPFADSATQMWFEAELPKYGGGGGGAGSQAASAEDEEAARRFGEAKEMVAGGKLAEGLSLASQLAARAADARTRFRGRLVVGELALLASKPEVGRPILEQLVQEISNRQLEDWEPALCASALSTLLATYRAMGLDFDRPEIRPHYERLCRLDPAAGLKWSGS